MGKNLRRAMLSCAGCTLMLFVTCGLAFNVFSAAQPYVLAQNGFTNTQTSMINTIRALSYLGCMFAAPLFFRLVRQIAAGRGIAGDSIRPDGLNLSQADICAATGDLADAYCPQTVKSYFIPGVTRIKLSG